MVLEPDHDSSVKRVVALEIRHDNSTIKFNRFDNVILSAGEYLQDEEKISKNHIRLLPDAPAFGALWNR